MTTTYATRKTPIPTTYQSNGYGYIRTARRIEYVSAPTRTDWLIVTAGLLICLSMCAAMVYMIYLSM